jgi:hypothetical protein
MTNPVFKTFYNHRVFVIYQPEDYRQYLLRIVEQKDWPEEEKFGLTLGLMAWGTILVYQARMVAADFHRRLKGLVDAGGAFLYQNPSLPRSRSIYRQQLAMQLGIEAIARTPEVKERIEETPIVAQYIYDTLYMPSYYHERGLGETSANGETKPFQMTRDGLREHLKLRSSGGRGGSKAETDIRPATKADTPPATKADVPPESTTDIPLAEIDYLFRGVLKNYLKLLSRPKEIQEKTRQYAMELPPFERRLWLALADVVDEGRPLVKYSVGKVRVAQKRKADGNTNTNG